MSTQHRTALRRQMEEPDYGRKYRALWWEHERLKFMMAAPAAMYIAILFLWLMLPPPAAPFLLTTALIGTPITTGLIAFVLWMQGWWRY